MQTVWTIFNKQVISIGLQLSHSPDLKVCDSYLWGNLEQNVYRNNLHSLEALEIKYGILFYKSWMVNFNMSDNLLCYEVYLDVGGHHFQ